jgi:predicted HAD superfamily Cof-like phosphohydrolase
MDYDLDPDPPNFQADHLVSHIDKLDKEIAAIRLQRDQLQAKCTAQLLELRALKEGRTALSGQVEAFMHLFDQTAGSKIGWPLDPTRFQINASEKTANGASRFTTKLEINDKTIRLAMCLVIEEAFEFLEAVCEKTIFLSDQKADALKLASELPLNLTPEAFIEAIDALGDLDYVSEWSRLAFGILDSKPIADEIQRSNIAKVGGTKDPKTGKKQKPPGWTPPDIRGVLVKMGWEL